jgi:hypothetical protein
MIYIGRLRRDRGISVARPTPLGNPFEIGKPYERVEAIARYRDWIPAELDRNPKARKQLDRIIEAARASDVVLLCWCAPLPCHAEIVAELAQASLPSNSETSRPPRSPP